MPSITYQAKVGSGATPFYGQLIVSNLQYDDGSEVTIKNFLGITFKSPSSLRKDDVIVSTNPWQNVTPTVDFNQIDDSTFLITVKLNFENPYKFNVSDTITFGINGDLTKHPDTYLDSFAFAADALPDTDGTVEITAASAPDPALASLKVSLVFQQGFQKTPVDVPLDDTTSVKLPAGDYTVSAAELATEDQTTVAATQVSPTSLTVKTGESTDVEVSFGSVSKYSAVDVTIGDISALQGEKFHVQLTVDGNLLTDFYSPVNHTTSLRRLPAEGTLEVSVDGITLNNVKYTLPAKSETLSAELFTFTFGEDDVKSSPVDTTGFVELPIVVKSDIEVDQDILVRLTSMDVVYTQKVPAKAGTTPFSVPVAPGDYTVGSASFINSGTVYVVEAATNLTVAKDGSTVLELELLKGAELNVKGFPDHLSFGALVDLTPNNVKDLVAARISSIFKYAGIDGAGDKHVYLTDDTATRRTIQLARDVEKELADGSKVLPVMISYTCNLSLGYIDQQLQDTKGLTCSLANLILALNIANGAIDDDHPVPAGFIVNADFLGEGQKENLTDYPMPVREPLQGALDHWKIDKEIPASITDTFAGYTHGVNWLIRTVAPSVTFGWQVNIWGGGTSTWIYNSGPDNNDPFVEANKTTAYIKKLGTYDGEFAPDFLAIDRYEADDWTRRAYPNGYFYGPYEWRRYYDFVKDVSVSLQVPVMPWQIPASHAPLVTDTVSSDYDSQHWGTGGSYLLGDADINSDYHNINPTVLLLELNPTLIKAKTAAEVWQRGEPFDLSQPAYLDFPLRGIFAVLLGGGSTTGVISTVGNAGPWVTDRLNAYAHNPIGFDDTSSDASKAKASQSTRIVGWWSKLWKEWRGAENA
ncbi:uncharacterized protein TrAFT101_007977 [Trichoderma asperellum]|uniref:Chitinase n=1 Tax=Trichoderma asperellum (strain ATCC 204424 / CBS 433.97 / NBRC 101777) TaxID=1042311 RepID=A0A2T3Z361_TRIA4|nr:hypothetical protein M441DRAFT_59307 [Trichoderma asperellum CBS 433.97]PTB39234.1 hypothetical protein M441DRAFT_59307 [Trichoderma asperellum CBS 433.97]UKZ93044.1 hypothetical protein TrAFT101_007977 [Trichoderma asperellum]